MGIQFLNINLDAIDESCEYKRMFVDVANIGLQVDVSFKEKQICTYTMMSEET